MPTTPGIPLPFHTAGVKNQFDWINPFGNETEGVGPRPAHQGQPSPMSWWQRRTVPQRTSLPQPVHFMVQGPQFDRGADAFAPQFGQLHANVIGAGIPSSYKLPVIAGPGARYNFGAIWFGVQAIPTSVQFNSTVPVETINALLATSSVSAMYVTSG
jgi:hypothetical protein